MAMNNSLCYLCPLWEHVLHTMSSVLCHEYLSGINTKGWQLLTWRISFLEQKEERQVEDHENNKCLWVELRILSKVSFTLDLSLIIRCRKKKQQQPKTKKHTISPLFPPLVKQESTQQTLVPFPSHQVYQLLLLCQNTEWRTQSTHFQDLLLSGINLSAALEGHEMLQWSNIQPPPVPMALRVCNHRWET